MLFKKPRFDPANNWRFRYHVGYLVLCGIVSVADLGFAAVTKLYDLGTPSYVYGVALVVSLIEGLYIAIAVVCIEFHVGTKTRIDLGKELGVLWCGSLTINLAYLLGGYTEEGVGQTFYVALVVGVISQVGGLILVILARMLHILLLTDPEPEKHGYHPKTAYKRHKRKKHGHEEKDLESGGDSDGTGSSDDDDGGS